MLNLKHLFLSVTLRYLKYDIVTYTCICVLKKGSSTGSFMCLTHISLASFLLDIGKQNSPRCDAAKRGVPSGTILFAYRILIEKRNKNEKITTGAPRNESGLVHLKVWESPFGLFGLMSRVKQLKRVVTYAHTPIKPIPLVSPI